MSSSSDSTMRITGIASGLDTESIISVLVAAKKVPITDLQNKIADEEKQVSAYTELQTLLSGLESSANTLTLSSTWNGKTATSSKTDVATATATSDASTGSYNVNVTTLASAEIVRGTSQSSSATYGGSFTINGALVTVNSGSSLSSVASAINTAASNMSTGKKVKAYTINNTLVIEKEDTGATTDSSGNDNANAIVFADGSSKLLQTLGVVDSSGKILDKTDGANLKASINGVSVSSSSNTVTDIAGLTITATGAGSTTVSVGSDTGKIKSAINDFLDAYNAVTYYIDKTTKVTVNSASEAVSAGILQGQFYVSNVQTKLFQYMSKVLSNPELGNGYDSLNNLGIKRDDSTGYYSITDENALTSALSSNFEDVVNIFKGGDSSGYYGIAKTMDNYLQDTVLDKLDGSLPSILSEKDSAIEKDQEKVTDLGKQLSSYEVNLYQHYSSMETMVENWNSQLKYLLSQLGVSS